MTDVSTMPDVPNDRLGELRAAVARLRVGAARGNHEHTLMVFGGVLAGIGVLAVLLGWVGASHTPNSFEQIPYLISGGLLGLALVFLGGFLYFAHWVTVLIRESRAQSDRTAEALDRIATLLVAADADDASGRFPAVVTPMRARTAGKAAGVAVEVVVDEPLYATPNGSMLHRRDCPVIANRANARVVAHDTPGFTLCRICSPD